MTQPRLLSSWQQHGHKETHTQLTKLSLGTRPCVCAEDVKVQTNTTHRLIVQPELLLRLKADMELVVLQENIIRGETVTGEKLTLAVLLRFHHCLLK